MNNKCSKYEGLFVFSDEETLKKHLEECEECRKEQEKMDRVSELIGEVKFHYKAKSNKKTIMKIACAFMLVLFSATTYTVIENYDNLTDSLMYGESLSAEELGFPVDSYGLITVDE